MAEIRNYRITYKDHFDGEHTEVIQAYDLNEALVQFSVAHRGKDHEITEIIPFKYIEEQKPVTEQKKEVHVKSIPKHLFPMHGLDTTKLPDTD